MTRDEVIAHVREKISDVVGVSVEEIDPDEDVTRRFGIDSLELMEIGTRLETVLQVRIDPKELRNIVTPAELATYLHGLVEEA